MILFIFFACGDFVLGFLFDDLVLVSFAVTLLRERERERERERRYVYFTSLV